MSFRCDRSSLLVVVGATALLGLGATSAISAPSSAAPPTVICGKTIDDAPSGAVIYRYTKAGTFDVPSSMSPANPPTVVRLAASCSKGVAIPTIKGLRIVKKVQARDGRVVAVALKAKSDKGTLRLVAQRRTGARTNLRFTRS